MSFKASSLVINAALALSLFAGGQMFELSPLLAYVFAINTLTFAQMGKDKMAAKFGLTRTPESTLLLLATLGGFPALFAGRHVFRHKTTKSSFIMAMWVLFALQLVVGAYILHQMDLSAYGLTKKTSPTAETTLSPAS